jgi:hypothetical protein
MNNLHEQQMIAAEILYVALATVAVLIMLQVFAYVATRVMYPPEPKIIYRNVPVPMAPPQQYIQQQPQFAPQQPMPQRNEPALTQPTQEVKLPEYEPRKPASDSLRVDPELPLGLQETRPPGL